MTSPSHHHHASPHSPLSPPPPRPRSTIRAILLLLALTSMTTSLYTLPLTRVIEMRVCQDYYNHHHHSEKGDGRLGSLLEENGGGRPVDERLCKEGAVQAKLAWLLGVMDTTQIICDLAVTLPLGYLAPRIGRRKILWINLAPRMFLCAWALVIGRFASTALPVEAILIGPFLAILGGECVFQSMILTLTSRLSQDYVLRASYFAYISSISYVVSFIGPSLAALTMSISLWLPFFIGLGLLSLAIYTVQYIPDLDRDDLLHASETSSLLHAPADQREIDSLGATGLFWFVGSKMVQGVKAISSIVAGRHDFSTLLVSFILTAIASSDTKLLPQYISNSYGWTFAQAGYLLSAKASINIALLTIVVPWAIRSGRRYSQTEWTLNIAGAETSLIVSILGVLCVASSSKFWMLMCSLVIYALGSALPVFTMSLVKLSENQDYRGHRDIDDFSIVVIVKTIGSLIGAPLMTVLWVKAIHLGGAGLGLPYFVSACFYTVALGVIRSLRRTQQSIGSD